MLNKELSFGSDSGNGAALTHLAYVDSSNLFIEAQKVSAVARGMGHGLRGASISDPAPNRSWSASQSLGIQFREPGGGEAG